MKHLFLSQMDNIKYKWSLSHIMLVIHNISQIWICFACRKGQEYIDMLWVWTTQFSLPFDDNSLKNNMDKALALCGEICVENLHNQTPKTKICVEKKHKETKFEDVESWELWIWLMGVICIFILENKNCLQR